MEKHVNPTKEEWEKVMKLTEMAKLTALIKKKKQLLFPLGNCFWILC